MGTGTHKPVNEGPENPRVRFFEATWKFQGFPFRLTRTRTSIPAENDDKSYVWEVISPPTQISPAGETLYYAYGKNNPNYVVDHPQYNNKKWIHGEPPAELDVRR